jgi:hypothetical protein
MIINSEFKKSPSNNNMTELKVIIAEDIIGDSLIGAQLKFLAYQEMASMALSVL